MYVTGFSAAVPAENREAYLKHAKTVSEIMREHGALRCVECWGDSVPDGAETSFHKAVKCQKNEAIVFGWSEWESKESCEQGMRAFMTDSRTRDFIPPFDASRLIWGGFHMAQETGEV